MTILQDLFRWFHSIESKDDECFTVTVKEGQSLSGIAREITGDEKRWHELVAANPGRQFDENYTIQPGERFHIPHDWLED